MDQKSELEELERRLAQLRRLSSSAADPVRAERFKVLMLELEEKIRKAQ
jgi:TATA-binding protein-associated factor Taf7